MQRELIRLATIDPLTGLSNRRDFFEQATEACARTAPPDGSVSAIILDIDNFKQINDAYGHGTGDEAIRACARAARIDEAVTGRLGDDEFALILEEKSLPQAIEIAEGLRKRLAERPFDTVKGRIGLTCSLSVGEGKARDTVDQILARADVALYDAKLRGRNCVVGNDATVPVRNAVVPGMVRAAAVSARHPLSFSFWLPSSAPPAAAE
jgi:two-component system cell cycle response regulator